MENNKEKDVYALLKEMSVEDREGVLSYLISEAVPATKPDLADKVKASMMRYYVRGLNRCIKAIDRSEA